MNKYDDVEEQNLLELKKQKEDSDRKMLIVEIILGIATLIMYLSLFLIVYFSETHNELKTLIIIFLTIFVFIISLLMLRIEQLVGYYECKKCNHKYIPTYLNVLFAPHINRTRYMKCLKCFKRSWHKKVISK